MDNRYYIIGIKHCGKSTVGKKLAEYFNLPFFDLDELIERSVFMGVREYYKQYGKESFQEVELKVLKELEDNSTGGFICATGGGICDNIDAFKMLNISKNTIFINTSFDTVYSRIIKNGVPAFLVSDDPKSEFEILFSRRNKLYKELAYMEINGDNISPQEIIEKILEQIKELQIARK